MQTLSQQSALGGTDTVTSNGETLRNSENQAWALTFPCVHTHTHARAHTEEKEDRNIFPDYVNISFPPQIIFGLLQSIYFSLIIEKKNEGKNRINSR